ncbi:thioredoxin family protein [Sulfurisphaera ohwakuensis]|uniref:Alkyl hydroperoxide reductase subunit AhpF n=1 Tax=Sulfurisphaera ohwakuensis TaxID=69656 RepID=A0A650CI96_SULOH|nr:thioredoxin family protein [Sulfurisphaera ohwakuensis]MBB5254582.1 alkyl hydroperoxide reductase subunit AhpF [Sulfurisphaera ohwakuensis]QGR17584.1 glutaredoxin [Sulfurisphaera ohwakuensis]
MSYDYIVSQYLAYIKDITLEGCKAEEIFDYFKDKLNIVSKEGCDKPYIKVYKNNRLYFSYYGIPAINEFWPFLNALVRISNNVIQLDEKEKELAANIYGNIKLFVTPDCTKCPIAAELLYQLPILNSNISLEIIDVTTYDDLGKKYRVLNVPKIVLNEKTEIPGSFPPTIILKMLAKGSEQH